jgi:hypothetical protein
VLDGFIGDVVAGEPVAGALMERSHPARLGSGEALLQQSREEVVVAVPAPFMVEGNQEQVCAFKRLEGVLP